MPQTLRPRPLLLMILDGFGISFLEKGNAITAAGMTRYEQYLRAYPCAALTAAGPEVGLPWGEVGNSEVGHKNMGSGRVLYQSLPQISRAIDNKSFRENVAFQQAAAHVKERPRSSLHLMGCVSTGGVHSHLDHLLALLDFAKRRGVGNRTVVHAFLDGRDTPPQSAREFLQKLAPALKSTGARLATLVGRFYAMDRNNNWDRTKAAYDLLVSGKGTAFPDSTAALAAGYRLKPSDEYLPPSLLGENVPRVQDGDAVIYFNFRPDRARQLTEAFTAKNFRKFRVVAFKDLAFVTMADYGQGLPVSVAFPEEWAEVPIGRVIAEAGLRQLRIAETEKYAHVTYYLNSGRELPFPNEDRVLIPSPKVQDYVKTPRMSAEAVTDRVIREVESNKYDVIVLNYANPDMLGHTGDFAAAQEALRFLDEPMGRVVDATLAAGGAVLLTGDHGNVEEMTNPQTGAVVTDHSANPVPLVYLASTARRETPKTDEDLAQALGTPIGILADIGPTVLDILGLEKPKQMTAQSLLSHLR